MYLRSQDMESFARAARNCAHINLLSLSQQRMLMHQFTTKNVLTFLLFGSSTKVKTTLFYLLHPKSSLRSLFGENRYIIRKFLSLSKSYLLLTFWRLILHRWVARAGKMACLQSQNDRHNWDWHKHADRTFLAGNSSLSPCFSGDPFCTQPAGKMNGV